MSTDDKELSKDAAGLPDDDDVKSRRELLAATAKLSAFISAVGLSGVGLSSGALAQPEDEEEEDLLRRSRDTKARRLRSPRMHKVRPKLREKRLLPAVQKRELTGLLQDAIRTGDTELALKRHPNLKLNRRQKAALNRMSRRDWAQLRSLQAKLAPLEARMKELGNHTGVIIH